MSNPSSPIKPVKTPWAGATDLNREVDYTVLEKLITYGRVMEEFGLSYKEAESFITERNMDVKKYQELLPRGKTIEERDAILKDGLVRAHKINPMGLVEIAAGGPLSKPKQVVTQFVHEHGVSDEGMRAHVVGLISSLLEDRYATERASNRVSLIVDGKGQSISAVRGDERKRAASTNMITDWNPSKGGLIPYINKKITQTCLPKARDHLLGDPEFRANSVSADALMEQGGEIADFGNGRHGLVRTKVEAEYEGANVSEDEVSQIVSADELERESRDEKRRMRDEAITNGELADESEKLEPDDIAAEEAPSQVKGSKGAKKWSFDPMDPHREDLDLILNVLEANKAQDLADDLRAAASPEARFRGMQAAVLGLVEKATGMEEHPEAVEIARDWDPSKYSLETWLPEFEQHAEANNNKFESPPPKTPVAAKSVSVLLQQVMQMDLFAPDVSAPAEDHVEHAKKQIDYGRLWRMKSTPEMCADPNRLDYSFLAEANGIEAPCPIDTLERQKVMRELALSWIGSRVNKIGQEPVRERLEKGISTWNPATKFFSEAVGAMIVEMIKANVLTNESIEVSAVSMQTEIERAAIAKRVESDPSYADSFMNRNFGGKATGVTEESVVDLEIRRSKTWTNRADKTSTPLLVLAENESPLHPGTIEEHLGEASRQAEHTSPKQPNPSI